MKFTTVNPVTGDEIKSYDFFNENQIRFCIDQLHQGQLLWKKLKVSERQAAMHELAHRMKDRKNTLVRLISEEMGKPIKESALEVSKCIKTVEMICEQSIIHLEPLKLSSIYAESTIKYEPMGIIYSIMPWNFPLWQVIRMVLPTLLSGNVILLKHSEIMPELAKEIGNLFENIFEKSILINAYISHEHTDFVMKQPEIGGASLTGSVEAGRSVYKIAAQYFKKVVLELGGSDPYIILKDADLSLAAKKIVKSRLLNNGQTCISAKRCIIDKSVLDKFLPLMKEEFDRYTIGNPADLKTDLGPLSHPKFKKALFEQLQALRNITDAKLVYSKSHEQSEKSAFVNIEAYLLSKNTDWLKNQEFFAPVLLIIPFETEEQALQIANSTDYALGAGLFTKDTAHGYKLAEFIIAGQVTINDIVSTDLNLPFGGFKSSGIGRELGREGYFEFTQTKVVSHV
jgi:succinate-semialdehyde dehydrogenase/glutarate-semialdehyde dehydrogenase